MPTGHDQRLQARFAALAARGLARALPRISHRRGVRYRLDGREVVGLCSNDYLGLADHPALASFPATSPGATASRLITGDLEIHRHLEAKLAEHVGAEDAVLFPSGYQLNVGVIPALLDVDDVAYSDVLNHASLIDGLRLSKTPRTILAHVASPARPRPDANGFSWWITEAVFSMDGDRADTRALARHVDRGGCLYLDEAHSFGLFPRGLGLAGTEGLLPTALVCTLGKAAGCAGAFVAGSRLSCEWIRTRARSFVFTTGVSPVLAQRIDCALELLRGPEGDRLRERLWNNVRLLGRLLDDPEPPSSIFPLIVGSNQHALRLSEALAERGWHVQAIRPPTVPDGTARLRVTVTAAHEPDQLARFAEDLRRLVTRHAAPLRVERGLAEPLPPSGTGVPR